MSINIKNPETHRLARELAELTGENMTTAVTVAVRERRDRVLAQRAGSRAEQMLKLGRDCARRLPASVRAVDHGELLYGDDGLPR
jgi:antitoxin VapB